MKELSVKEKAQSYDWSIEKAKEYLNSPRTCFDIEQLYNIFPELCKSDGEKLRKWLIKYFEEINDEIDVHLKKKIITWLEEQGEQNLADKVEPNFYEGDWVVLTAGDLSTTLQIVNVDTSRRLYWFNDRSYLPIVDEECLHLWTIQDAKDGDVLAVDDDNICIFDGTVEDGIYPFAYCGFTKHGFKFYDGKLPFTHSNVYPATKEQRDTLIKAMADVGYTFDFEKKELKKIELTKSESEEELSEFEAALFSAFSDGWQQYLHGEEVDVAQWAKEHSAELLEAARQNHAAWSEEDDMMLECVLDKIGDLGTGVMCKGWLESLRQRMTWKPSKEQMYMLEWLTTNVLDDGVVGNKAKEVLYTLIEQLKSL